jgi:hypothetical protein
MEAALTHEAFTQHANTQFQVLVAENTAVPLELIEISDVKLYPHQEQFGIVFRGPSDMFLGQGSRYFSHEHMGQFELFIVPIRQDEHGVYYEAIFNRLREQST